MKTRPYRPSNSTEGEMFQAQFCYRCIHDIDESCAILTATLIYHTGHPDYPKEWIEDDIPGIDTNPRCTAFATTDQDAELAACLADARQQRLL